MHALSRSEIRYLILNEIYQIKENQPNEKDLEKEAEKQSKKVKVKDEDEQVKKTIEVLEKTRKYATKGKNILRASYGKKKKKLWTWLFNKVFGLSRRARRQIFLYFKGIVKFTKLSAILFKFMYEVSKIPEKERQQKAKKIFYEKIVPQIVKGNKTDFIMACVYAAAPGIGLLGMFVSEFLVKAGLYVLERDINKEMMKWRDEKLDEIELEEEAKSNAAKLENEGKQSGKEKHKEYKQYAMKMNKKTDVKQMVAESKRLSKYNIRKLNRLQLRKLLTYEMHQFA
jgi:hypothetical protein